MLLRPTGFVDSPFGHDGKVARLAGGLSWFSAVEAIEWDGSRRASTELIPVERLIETIGNMPSDAETYAAFVRDPRRRIFYRYTDATFGGRRIESYDEVLADVPQ